MLIRKVKMLHSEIFYSEIEVNAKIDHSVFDQKNIPQTLEQSSGTQH